MSQNEFAVESLENRRLFSLDSAVLAGGVLQVTGTQAADTITVGLDSTGTNVEVVITTPSVSSTPSVDKTFALARVKSIIVHGLGGDDTISVDATNGPLTNIKLNFYGDSGDDTLIGGADNN